MTREEWKVAFTASLWNKMNPDNTTKAMTPDGDQVFGDFVVRINGKKHRNGDRVVIRIGRGITTRKAALFVKAVLLIDYNDPSEYAEEVANYLRLKLAGE